MRALLPLNHLGCIRNQWSYSENGVIWVLSPVFHKRFVLEEFISVFGLKQMCLMTFRMCISHQLLCHLHKHFSEFYTNSRFYCSQHFKYDFEHQEQFNSRPYRMYSIHLFQTHSRTYTICLRVVHRKQGQPGRHEGSITHQIILSAGPAAGCYTLIRRYHGKQSQCCSRSRLEFLPVPLNAVYLPV